MGFANEELFNLFPDTIIQHLLRDGSDHSPIVCHLTTSGQDLEEDKGSRPFRFDAIWLDDEHCSVVVENGWNNPGSVGVDASVMGKLARCADDLHSWDRRHFGNVSKELCKVREQLDDLQKGGMNGSKAGRR